MFFALFRSRQTTQAAKSLYDIIVKQARTPAFYSDFEVPDTVDGRFDMVCLHMFLVLNRLRGQGRAGKAVSQALFDTMFVDVDYSVREQGIGDLAVPRHMKRMMRALKGRCVYYERALPDADAIKEALRRNLYGTVSDVSAHSLAAVANYMVESVASLEKQVLADILNGKVKFPQVSYDAQKQAA